MFDNKMKEEDLVQLYKDYWYVYKTIKNCKKKIQLKTCEKLVDNFSDKWFYFIGRFGLGFLIKNRNRLLDMEYELRKKIKEKSAKKFHNKRTVKKTN